jgi:acyl carrier protein
MTDQDVFRAVLTVIKNYARDELALQQASFGSQLIHDLKVNSARLVDLILELEDRFGIDVSDDEADRLQTLGDAVNLIVQDRGHSPNT